jgi:hypothetical protein
VISAVVWTRKRLRSRLRAEPGSQTLQPNACAVRAHARITEADALASWSCRAACCACQAHRGSAPAVGGDQIMKLVHLKVSV